MKKFVGLKMFLALIAGVSLSPCFAAPASVRDHFSLSQAASNARLLTPAIYNISIGSMPVEAEVQVKDSGATCRLFGVTRAIDPDTSFSGKYVGIDFDKVVCRDRNGKLMGGNWDKEIRPLGLFVVDEDGIPGVSGYIKTVSGAEILRSLPVPVSNASSHVLEPRKAVMQRVFADYVYPVWVVDAGKTVRITSHWSLARTVLGDRFMTSSMRDIDVYYLGMLASSNPDLARAAVKVIEQCGGEPLVPVVKWAISNSESVMKQVAFLSCRPGGDEENCSLAFLLSDRETPTIEECGRLIAAQL